MRLATFARLCKVALAAALVLLGITLASFAAQVAGGSIAFARDIALGAASRVEISAGPACPHDMPSLMCHYSGLEQQRELRVVYYDARSSRVLVAVRLPSAPWAQKPGS